MNINFHLQEYQILRTKGVWPQSTSTETVKKQAAPLLLIQTRLSLARVLD